MADKAKETATEAAEKASEQDVVQTNSLAQAQDEMAEKNAATIKEPEAKEEVETEEEPSEASEEPSTSKEKKDGEEDSGLDEVDELIQETSKKDNVQKRIDALTAKIKTLEEENITLKNVDLINKGKDPEYTDAQLRVAYKKAFDEGDAALADEIQSYREKRLEERLIKKYEEAEKSKVEQVNRVQQEWGTVVNDFSYLADQNEPEYYRGSHLDLNLKDPNSLLYKVALALYGIDDPHLRKVYQSPGGQRLAVADALARILRKKGNSPQDGEKKKLKRQLTREKMKHSLSGSNALDVEKTSKKPKSDKEEYDSYIEERKKFRQDRGGF